MTRLIAPGRHSSLRAFVDRHAAPRRVQLGGDRYRVIVPPGAVRIDRATVFGNPFPVAVYGLDVCLDWYRRYLAGDGAAVEEARRIGWRCWRRNGPDLVRLAVERIGTAPVACWCGTADRCHGDVLVAAVAAARAAR